jgi:dienelactone hydrolase
MIQCASTTVAVAAAALVISQASVQTPLEGDWVGHWVRDNSALEVTMSFSRNADAYSGSFGSERLRAKGIPLQKVSYQPPHVSWQVQGDETTTVFEAELRGDQLRGRFRDGTAQGTFVFTRSAAPSQRIREDTTSFRNGTVTLEGTFVLPHGTGPFPGVVFLHGSGPEGRWASHFLAHQFARAGLAALMYDKRGVGGSTGSWQEVGPEELAQDAAAAVSAMRARPEISPNKVGIHGNSQGGTIAPLVASRFKDLAFVVASAGSGVPADDCEAFSLENFLRVGSMSQADALLARQYVQAIVATAYRGAPRQGIDAAWKQISGKPWADKPPPETAHFWKLAPKFAKYDPLASWSQLSAAALLVYGENDERVPARRSAARIAQAYLAGQGHRLNVMVFEGADHTFHLPAERPDRFSWPRSAPGYPDAVIRWVNSVVRP